MTLLTKEINTGDGNELADDLEITNNEVLRPVAQARQQIELAKREGRIKCGSGFDGSKARVAVAIPLHAELINGNIIHILEDFLSQDNQDFFITCVVNSIQASSNQRKVENQYSIELIEYVMGYRDKLPAVPKDTREEVGNIFTDQDIEIIEQARERLKDKMVLVDLNAQMPRRDMKVVRSVGTLLSHEYLGNDQKPITWLDGDTRIVNGYIGQIDSLYKYGDGYNIADAWFLHLRYEIAQAPESVAQNTIDYQFTIAEAYLKNYWRRTFGNKAAIGLGGPLITARAGVFVKALDHLSVSEGGGNEDYEMTRILNNETIVGYASDVFVRTADRVRPTDVGFDSADRGSNVQAGAVVTELKRQFVDLPTVFMGDVLEGLVKGEQQFDSDFLDKLKKTVAGFGINIDDHELLSFVDDKLDGYDTEARYYEAIFDQNAPVYEWDNVLRSRFVRIIREYCVRQMEPVTSIAEYGNHLNILFQNILQTSEEQREYEALVVNTIARDNIMVEYRRTLLQEALHQVRHPEQSQAQLENIKSTYPFLLPYLETGPTIPEIVDMVANKYPDLFSLTDPQAIDRRQGLATTIGATRFLSEVITNEDRKSRFPSIKALKNVIDGKGYQTAEQYTENLPFEL